MIELVDQLPLVDDLGEPDRGRPVDELEGRPAARDASSRSSGASAACRNPCRAASGSRGRSGTCDCRRGLRCPWPLCDLTEPLGRRQGRVERVRDREFGADMNATAAGDGPLPTSPAARRPVRHLPRRPDPPDASASPRSSCSRTPAARSSCPAQTCCGQPAYNSGDRATAKAHRAPGDRGVRGLRLCRRAERLLRRHARQALSRAVRRRAGAGARRPSASPPRRMSSSASWSTCCGVERVDGALRRQRSPITIPARACASSASRRSRAACSRASRASSSSSSRRPRPAAASAALFARQIRRNLQRHRRAQGRGHRREPAPTPCSPATSAA